jgi:hypothetical protein
MVLGELSSFTVEILLPSRLTWSNDCPVDSNQLTAMLLMTMPEAPLLVMSMLKVFEPDVPNPPADIRQGGTGVNVLVFVAALVLLAVKVFVGVPVYVGVRE